MASCMERDILETMIMMIVTIKTLIVKKSKIDIDTKISVENRFYNHIHLFIHLLIQ